MYNLTISSFKNTTDCPDNTENDEFFVFFVRKGLVLVDEGNQETSHDVTELGDVNHFGDIERGTFNRFFDKDDNVIVNKPFGT